MTISLKMSETAEREGGPLLSQLIASLKKDGELSVRAGHQPRVRSAGRSRPVMETSLSKQSVESLLLNLFRLRAPVLGISSSSVAAFLNEKRSMNFSVRTSNARIRINTFLDEKTGFGFVARLISPFSETMA